MQVRQKTLGTVAHSHSRTKPQESGNSSRHTDLVELGSRPRPSEISAKDFRHLFEQNELEQSQETQEREEITSSFPGRNGYDSNFLGRPLPLPQLDPSIRDKAATLIGSPDKTELKYTNFSIVMNKERRQPFYSVVNIDGSKSKDLPRTGKWTIDSRIPRDQQLGNEAYASNAIDRGHMVRRRDPIWGPDAAQANTDTFVYTNAGLQHSDLNQKTWLDLENHIHDQATSKNMKLTVITGPVFSDSDPVFDNKHRIQPATKIPLEFFKVVVWNDPEKGLQGAGFVQSQKDLLGHSIFQSSFEPGGMSVYQLPIDKLEKMTKIHFGDIHDITDSARMISDPTQVKVG